MADDTRPRSIGRVQAVLVGRVAPYTRPGSTSAIAKQPVAGRSAAGPLGLEGDEQADTRVHGGPDKAIHCYAYAHYAAWRTELGPLDALDAPGAFGENLSILGSDENTLCLGDRLQIGADGLLLEVAQGRQPCWKLNDRFGIPDMAQRVQDTLRTGWYCRVLAAGSVGSGDSITLVARPHPDWSVARLMKLLYGRCLDAQILRAMLDLPLVPGWRRLVEQRMASRQVEDWSRRLDGPPR